MLINHLSKLAEADLDRKAVITESQALTYKQLWKTVRLKSDELFAQGLSKGLTVGISIKDEFQHFVVSLALLKIGCNQITLPTFESEEYNKSLSLKAGVTFIISDIVGTGALKIFCFISSNQSITNINNHITAPKLEGHIFFVTSGTTGSPKIIPLSEDNLFIQGKHWQYPESVDIFWRPTPIEYNNSKRQRLYNISCASTNVFIDASKTDLINTVINYKITRLNLSVVQARSLAENLIQTNRTLPENCHVRIGGSAVGPKLRSNLLENLTKNLHITYATSEFGSIATACPDNHCDMLNAGYIHPYAKLEIVDNSDIPVMSGCTGHIRIKSSSMANYYYNDPIATEKSFRDGWFYPGDMGRIETNGLLYISGRADDMLSLASINIFPSEIETAFCKHPDIIECAAFGIKSKLFGDIPILAVTLSNLIDMPHLEKYGRDVLGIRAPRKIFPIDRIPRNRGGKISKKELVSLFNEWKLKND